jgi:transmembrane sensor
MNTQDEDMLIIKFLAGEASEADVTKLTAWRNSHPSHEEQFLQSQSIWNRSNRTEDEIDIDAAWNQVESKLQNQGAHSNRFVFFRIAAVFLLVCTTGWFAFKALYNPTITIYTATNEHKEVSLPDGSTVWLNENSTFSFPKSFKGKNRQVALSGEAFFEVTKNPEQPFTIQSEQAITEVLGTSFNLKVLKGTKEALLNVITGKVRFTSTDNTSEVTIVAGEKAEISETGNANKVGLVVENELAWKSGKLVFNDSSLEEVFNTLERYFKIKITVENPDILTCHFTGTYTNPKADEIFESLSKALKLNYSRNGKKVNIKGKGCVS